MGGIDAHRASLRLQPSHRRFKMGERRIGQAAEIDDVGASAPQRARARAQRVERQRGSIDDLSEDAQVMAGEIGRAAAFAEIGRQVLHFVRAALKGRAKGLRQAVEIGPAAARQHDAARWQRAGQAIHQDRFGHQRGDLHADVQDFIGEGRRHRGEHGFEPRPCEPPGDEQQALAHKARSARRRASASASSLGESTAVTPSKRPSLSRFSRSIGRG